MDAKQVRTFSYNENDFKALMAEYKRLSTFGEVESWDRRASAETDRIVSAIRKVDEDNAELSEKLKQAEKERSEKPFFNRLFGSRKVEKYLAQQIENCRNHKAILEALAAQMQEAIDFTPNSPEEQKSLLKELKQRKKELQVEKREIAAAMKAIRTDARQKSSNAGRVFGLYDSKVAASDRRHIRYAKEAALGPHEDSKAALDRQITQVDRDILWAERFTK
jgi:hypothetical protein